MSGSLLGDAFEHHLWATERLLEACGALDAEQLRTSAPGTYGSIVGTLRHLVASDRWYLSFFPAGAGLAPLDEEDETLGIAELLVAIRANGGAWRELLAGRPDPEQDVTEIDNGWEFHVPLAVRLAQAVHHGTDHRSQVCTALSGLGVAPPDIDVWAYAEATGRSRAFKETT